MLSFLRCIFCCADEEEYQSDRSPCFNYHQVLPTYDTSPRTIAPTTKFITAQTTSGIHSQNTSNFPQNSRIPPDYYQLRREALSKILRAESGINVDTIKRTSLLTTEKGKVFPPSSTGSCAFQNNLDANRIIDPKLSPKSSSSSSSSSSRLPQSVSKPPLSSSKASSELPPPILKLNSSVSSSFSSGTPPPPKPQPAVSNKPILSPATCNPTTHQAKNKYFLVEKGSSPLYEIPENIKSLIKRDIVPDVLKKPLSPSTYRDYFAALLYAEDYYLEKWDGFEVKNVTLDLHRAEIHGRKGKSKRRNEDKDDKIFVEFEIDSIPEKRPFLLSRDFASVRPSGRQVEPFQGIVYRVMRSNIVLVEFGKDFHSQHYSACKYDIKFSFNRVCLKRAHQAMAAASDVLFKNFIFPDCLPNSNNVAAHPIFNNKLDKEYVVRRILNHHGPPPYLVEGPLSVNIEKQLSRTGVVVREAVLQICRTSSLNRILICAPLNSTCDVLMRSLRKDIPESDMFRANAAFREIDGVPVDILPFCTYKEECFSCPSLTELKKFKVILSTYMSTFRLHNEGIKAGHFSHMFLVDATSATEPETMVPLANMANERTTVVVTGAPRNRSGWVRSNIARQNGLTRSYFQRLRESKLYKSLDPVFITLLEDQGQKPDDTYRSPALY